MKKRILALACIVAVCISIPFTPSAYATGSTKVPVNSTTRWTNISSISLNISFNSGTANCVGIIVGNANVKKIEATFQLLKKNTSNVFVTHYTWPKVTVNSDYLAWSGSCSVTPGTYRLQVTAIVTNTSNVSETVVTYCEKIYT